MSFQFPTYLSHDIEIKYAKGALIIDTNDKKYIDFISGIAVCNLGHQHEDIKAAIIEQLDKVWHTSNLFKSSLREEVAQLLINSTNGSSVFFCNSGAEANEAALKLARKHTGKTKIVTFKNSFHGRTFATMSATGQAKVNQGFGPLVPTFEYIPFNDIHSLGTLEGDDYAAIMLEIVQGEGGVNPATSCFIETLVKTCRRLKALLIVDEVQTGIGRTGLPFGFQHYAISPDIITTAKGLGSGFPIGAMIGKKELVETFNPGTHGTTMGGNQLAMAAAKATLEIIFQDNFLREVESKGKFMLDRLKKGLKNVAVVQEVRGLGLMIGIELKCNNTIIIKELLEKGVITLAAGPNVIRIVPPLTISLEEIEKGIEIIIESLKNKY